MPSGEKAIDLGANLISKLWNDSRAYVCVFGDICATSFRIRWFPVTSLYLLYAKVSGETDVKDEIFFGPTVYSTNSFMCTFVKIYIWVGFTLV